MSKRSVNDKVAQIEAMWDSEMLTAQAVKETLARDYCDPQFRDYSTIACDIADTVKTKQAAYGDSFGKSGEVLRILYPEGIPLEKMDDALTIVRVLDKVFRIATDRDALGESPWRDIAGYALLAIERAERK